MKSKKAKFITATLLPYFTGEMQAGYDAEQDRCLYLDDNGNKCAIGQHMKEGEWQHSTEGICSILESIPHKWSMGQVFTEEFLDVDLTDREMQAMQFIHDKRVYKGGAELSESYVDKLEEFLCEPLPEIRDAVRKEINKISTRQECEML